MFAAKDVAAAFCQEDALAPKNAGRDNHRATHGRSRCKRCIPRARDGLVPDCDGSVAVVSAGLTLDVIAYHAVETWTCLDVIPARAPVTARGAQKIRTASS